MVLTPVLTWSQSATVGEYFRIIKRSSGEIYVYQGERERGDVRAISVDDDRLTTELHPSH